MIPLWKVLKEIFTVFSLRKRVIRGLKKATALSDNHIDDTVVDLVDALFDKNVVKVVENADKLLTEVAKK